MREEMFKNEIELLKEDIECVCICILMINKYREKIIKETNILLLVE
jgi:hypothetical protein